MKIFMLSAFLFLLAGCGLSDNEQALHTCGVQHAKQAIITWKLVSDRYYSIEHVECKP